MNSLHHSKLKHVQAGEMCRSTRDSCVILFIFFTFHHVLLHSLLLPKDVSLYDTDFFFCISSSNKIVPYSRIYSFYSNRIQTKRI